MTKEQVGELSDLYVGFYSWSWPLLWLNSS